MQVAEILESTVLRSGEPIVFASEKALARRVAWAHVLSGPEVTTLLDGGELVLTTGAGWPGEPAGIRNLTKELIDVGVAAIVLELGQTFFAAPKELIDECKRADVALVVLAQQVRFVQITQLVHKRILAAQSESLEARDGVHRMLTELGLNRSPVDYIIEQIAAELRAPVVLENIAGEVVAWAAPDTAASASTVLGSRTGSNGAGSNGAGSSGAGSSGAESSGAGSVTVRVEARGRHWGSLTAFAGPAHAAGRQTVLELGAFALALGRLADPEGDSWVQLAAKKLFDTILTGRYRHEVDLLTQLEASGLPIRDRAITALQLTGVGEFGAHQGLERAVLETALRRSIAPTGRLLISAEKDESLLALVSYPLEASPDIAVALAHELKMLVPEPTPAAWRVHLSVGVTGTGITGLLTSLEGVREAGILPEWQRIGRVTVQNAELQPLTYLLRSFRGSAALQSFLTEQLGPLLEYDALHSGDLLRVLECYIAHPNNRSQAAKAARLSRSVFYQRLEIIERLLGVSLSEGRSLTALAVAVEAHGLQPENGRSVGVRK